MKKPDLRGDIPGFFGALDLVSLSWLAVAFKGEDGNELWGALG